MTPTLIYDGDCGICKRWVGYWSALTGPQVVYRPYQEVAHDFPAIPPDAFRRSIQFIDSDGAVHAGAAATFKVLRFVPGRRAWWWLYAQIPGVAPASEFSYAFFARHRGLLSKLTTFLWGRNLPPERYGIVTSLFLRGLGLIYLAAFGSFALQAPGLAGSDGILPVASYLQGLREQEGLSAYALAPTLFWLNASDFALLAVPLAGMFAAMLIVIGKWMMPSLIAAFALYLSCVYAGQDFMLFQWDMLLTETGFLAIFLPGGSRIVVWLFRWTTFRYLLMAGAAKLLSGDQTWRGLTALQYHFETQPLPTPFAWHAAQLPHWMLACGTAATLFVEVAAVFLIFMPRNLRMTAAWCALVFEALISLTGNYNFFNLLTMLLCVWLFDDAAMRRVIPARIGESIVARTRQPARAATLAAAIAALAIVPLGADRLSRMFAGAPLPVIGAVDEALSPLLIVNAYGLFAMMTTTRPEIVIEGSNDGNEWREYAFRYKPGDVMQKPKWNIPHQPRLDWQMWFAALGGSWEEPWFASLLQRLLEGSPPVLALLGTNPFPDHPPKFVRATLYGYKFADAATHAATGQWWVRRKIGEFAPPLSLGNRGQTTFFGKTGTDLD